MNKAFKKCSISNTLDGSEDSGIYEEYNSEGGDDADSFADIDNKNGKYDDINYCLIQCL